MRMETPSREQLSALLRFCFAASVLLRESSSLESPPDTPDRPWQDAARVQYEMLMEHESRRFSLRRGLEDSEDCTELYVIQTNDTAGARNIARKYGFTFIRKVFEDEDYYVVRRLERKRRRRESFRDLGGSSEIQWAARQTLKGRTQRFLLDNDLSFGSSLSSEQFYLPPSSTKDATHSMPEFNDPLFMEQWYLDNRGQTGGRPENDIRVLPAWRSGFTGRGLRIAVLDDGVCPNSEEVAHNYDAASSGEYLYFNNDPKPVPENSHGTYCAAIAAGVANNGVCGVGVAYEAKVGGVRILEGPLTDVQEALAIVHALDRVDVYTASWGPTDQGRDVDGPGLFARMALVKGVTMGRAGRGSVYVWAAGNGGGFGDNCALDGYASSPFTLTVGALTQEGRSAFYSEPCAAVLVSVYVGGRSCAHERGPKDRINVVVPEGRGRCRETFQGTSAAAPMAAGAVALALQANPNLTWRDVQHLVVQTSRVPDTDEGGWTVNAAGHAFHPKMGSGALDTHALVEMAGVWVPAPVLRVWTSPVVRENRTLRPDTNTIIPWLVRKSDTNIDRLETVIATINLQHDRCGDLEMVLESPSGTLSTLLARRLADNETRAFRYWDFVSVHFWGESPKGVWMLRVSNHNRWTFGTMDFFAITLHGTED